MNAIGHTAFRLPSMPSAATLDTVQSACEIHTLYCSLLTISAVIDGVPAHDRHLQAYSEMVDRDVDTLAARARALLSATPDADARSLLRHVVLDHEMRCDLPGEEFQPLTAEIVSRAAP